MRQTQTLAVAVVLAVGLSVAPAAVVAVEDPRFEVVVPEPTLAPGQSAELTLLVTNDAEEADESVETAETVEVELRGGDTPITVQSGPRRLGAMADGDTREVSFRVTVPRDIPSGTHELSLRVAYEHDDEAKTQTVPTAVRIEDRPRFEVVDVATGVSVGGTGTYALTVRNVGSAAANATTVRLESGSAVVTFGGSGADTRFIGPLAPDEETTVVYPVSVSADADAQTYAATATVSYEDADGIARTAPAVTVGLTPAPEQRFSVAGVDAPLRVGEEGTVRGELVNEGEEPVRDLVLEFQPPNAALTVADAEYAVGDLAPGERGSFEFEVDVSTTATAGARLFTLVPSFRTGTDDRRAGEAIDLRATVGPERDAFVVAAVEAAFVAGEDGELAVEVTNNREEPVTDVSAKLFTQSPISVADDEAFLPELASGETRTVVFRIDVAGDALGKTYPVELDFRYRTAAGDTRLSNTYTVPVSVTRPAGDGLGPFVLGGVVVLVVVGGLLAYRYRRRPGPAR